MTVYRWVYHDPQDSDSSTNTYTVPRNPEKMTSPILDRPITAQGTLGGGFATWEGAPVAKQMTFSGKTVNKAHYDALLAWHQRRNRFTITDHFKRVMTVVPVSSDLVPVTRRNNYWNHEYSITVLVLSVVHPTGGAAIGDIWP